MDMNIDARSAEKHLLKKQMIKILEFIKTEEMLGIGKIETSADWSKDDRIKNYFKKIPKDIEIRYEEDNKMCGKLFQSGRLSKTG
jgi:hypothetical protein